MSELRDSFVVRFPGSGTRARLFAGWFAFSAAVGRLITVQREFVNGSFVTDKPDPKDVDTILWVKALQLSALAPAAEAQLTYLIQNSMAFYNCDAYLLMEDCPPSHLAHKLNKDETDLLLKYWRTPRNAAGLPMVGGPTKGYVVVT